MKRRKPFILLDCNSKEIGHGVAYAENNVQVFMRPDFAAWQMQLVDALALDGVMGFRWVADSVQRPQTPATTQMGNDVWNRLDGFYDKNEFEE